MTELGQQHLLEPDPARTVPAPPASAWYGVDPSTLRIAVGWSTPEGSLGAATQSFMRAEGPRRLAFIYRDTYTFVRSLATQVWPGYVLVEQPGGKHVPVQLEHAVGVIHAAIYSALHTTANAHGWPVPAVETAPPATWKKIACGAGNLYKPKRERGAPPPAFEDYPVAVWARENGYGGHSWDEADAIGLAVAARRTVRFE